MTIVKKTSHVFQLQAPSSGAHRVKAEPRRIREGGSGEAKRNSPGLCGPRTCERGGLPACQRAERGIPWDRKSCSRWRETAILDGSCRFTSRRSVAGSWLDLGWTLAGLTGGWREAPASIEFFKDVGSRPKGSLRWARRRLQDRTRDVQRLAQYAPRWTEGAKTTLKALKSPLWSRKIGP